MVKVNPSTEVLEDEKLMLVPVEAPKVAVPVMVALPGTTPVSQFAPALKLKLPSVVFVAVGLMSQVALCAQAFPPHRRPARRQVARQVAARARRIPDFIDVPNP